MTKPRRQIVTVHGTLCFPTDMLRYDSAWPRTEVDSRKIDSTQDGGSGFQEIQVLTDDPNAPNRDRWYSFGWKVIKIETAS